MYIEAFHTPKFSANTSSVGQLSDNFNILFTRDHPAIDNQSTCFITTHFTKQIVFSVKAEEGLYKMIIAGKNIAVHLAELTVPSASCDSCQRSIAFDFSVQHSTSGRTLEWHLKLGQPYSARYNQLAELFPSVRMFPQSTLDNILCVPCSLAKANRSTIHLSSRSVPFPL